MITADDIREALRKHYCQPEWSIFFEVANGTGANARRHADALAINMYPSRGLAMLGFEIKISRGDLARELVNPDKAEEIAQYCDEWWLVVPEGLIKENDDIPLPWGIMELHKDSLKVFKKATYLKPKPITRGFVAAVLRSAGKVDEKQLKTAWQNGWEKGHESAEQNKSFERERVVKELKSLKEGLAEFEKITGRSINQYTDFEGLAEQIQMAENYDELMSKYGILRHLRKNAKELIEKTNFLDDERKEATA